MTDNNFDAQIAQKEKGLAPLRKFYKEVYVPMEIAKNEVLYACLQGLKWNRESHTNNQFVGRPNAEKGEYEGYYFRRKRELAISFDEFINSLPRKSSRGLPSFLYEIIKLEEAKEVYDAYDKERHDFISIDRVIWEKNKLVLCGGNDTFIDIIGDDTKDLVCLSFLYDETENENYIKTNAALEKVRLQVIEHIKNGTLYLITDSGCDANEISLLRRCVWRDDYETALPKFIQKLKTAL